MRYARVAARFAASAQVGAVLQSRAAVPSAFQGQRETNPARDGRKAEVDPRGLLAAHSTGSSSRK